MEASPRHEISREERDTPVSLPSRRLPGVPGQQAPLLGVGSVASTAPGQNIADDASNQRDRDYATATSQQHIPRQDLF